MIVPYIDRSLIKYLKCIVQNKENKSRLFLTFSRRSTIPFSFVGLDFGVDTGRRVRRVNVRIQHVGLKFGALVKTKRRGARIHRLNRIHRKRSKLKSAKKGVKKKVKGKKSGKKALARARAKAKVKARLKKKAQRKGLPPRKKTKKSKRK